MSFIKIIMTLAFVGCSILIPLYFERILVSLVSSGTIGWVFGSILLRLIVILLFAIALKLVFPFFAKLKRINFFLVFLIAIIPGFGISFISPIYNTDYGMYSDDFVLTNPEDLNQVTGKEVYKTGEHTLVAFFTTTCPHCMAASIKLGANIQGGQQVKVQAFFPGTKEDTESFLNRFNGKDFNYYLVDDSAFMVWSGGSFPSIFLINPDGSTAYHWTGDEMNYSALDYLRKVEQ